MYRRSCLHLLGILAVAESARAVGAAPRVLLRTALGDILIEPDLRAAPLSAGAFLGCVENHFYDGGAFTRAVRPDNDHGTPPISVIQGAARAGLKLPAVAHETTRQTGLRHLDGTVSLPRDAVGTATGGEFFICVGDQPGLDYGGRRKQDGLGFAAFGRVLEGMEVVRRIDALKTTGPSQDAYTAGQMLAPPLAIVSARS